MKSKMKMTLQLAILSVLLISCSNETHIEVKETILPIDSLKELSTEELSTEELSTEELSTEELSTEELSTEELINELDGVWIEPEFVTYKEGVNEINIKWNNDLNDEIMFGEFFIIDKKVEEEWQQVKSDDEIYVFTLLGYKVNPYETLWHRYSLLPYTKGLEQGEYRITINFHRETLNGSNLDAGNYPEYQTYCFFNVE